MAIQIKSLDQLKLMRAAGKIVWKTLTEIKSAAAIGVTTVELDDIARKDRKSTRLNSSHSQQSRMPSSA